MPEQDDRLQQILDQIPDEFAEVEGIIKLIFDQFPEVIGQLGQKRIDGWIQEMNSGTGRSSDDIRDDISQWIITKGRMMATFGINEETAEALVQGQNDGGINFSDFLDPDFITGETTGPTTSDNPEDNLQLFSGITKWYKDPKSGLYYGSYKLKISGRELVFEASEQQMDSLFGDGIRPRADVVPLKDLIGRDEVIFSGLVDEVAGEGNFQGNVDRVIALALDAGKLPKWAENNAEVEELLFISLSENKGTTWLIEQLAKTDAFQVRFPGVEIFMAAENMTVTEAIEAHLESETKLRQMEIQAGRDGSRITPDIVAALADKGYDIKTVEVSYGVFKRMNDFAPAFDAFNEVLLAGGLATLGSTADMFGFLTGTAPAEVYELYEASSLREAAEAAGIGDFFAADEAIEAAARATFAITPQTAFSVAQRAAADILRFRSEINLGKYGLDPDDLIDLALGIAPRSGRSQTDINEGMDRALQEAAGFLKERIKPFFGFTSKGRPQAISFGELRQTSV